MTPLRARLPKSALRLLGLLSSAAGLVLLALAVPRAAGTDWAAVRAHLGHISGPQVALLCALAGATLWSYTYVLGAALPGLTQRQAMLVHCTGSAVSNLLPLGGGAGVAVTYAMTRRWGHPPHAVAVCVALTGVCNVAARLVLSAVGALMLVGTPVPGIGWAAAAGGRSSPCRWCWRPGGRCCAAAAGHPPPACGPRPPERCGASPGGPGSSRCGCATRAGTSSAVPGRGWCAVWPPPSRPRARCSWPVCRRRAPVRVRARRWRCSRPAGC
ncbi:hypothetical protein O1L68_21450 [Streptomyces lydicus]|nr:hypothetical protein [Streptomyces lydicus]